MGNGPKHGSGKRTGAFAESKCTNFMPYEPVYTEIKLIHLRLPDRIAIPIFERPLHPEFVRPCSVDDVMEFLRNIPPEFLAGLNGIYLLGGTAKQRRGAVLPDGCYDFKAYKIYLAACPKNDLVQFWSTLPPPHCLHEIKSAGVQIARVKGGWEIRYDETTLRRYTLESVLLHEIGHHVARDENKTHRKKENFADWFAREITRKTPK